MTLLEKLHTLWAADATLTGLLAATKVVTGLYQAREWQPPFVVLKRPGDGQPQHDRDGEIEEITIHFVLCYLDYDAGLALAEALKQIATFNHAVFSVDTAQQVILMDRTAGYAEVQDSDTGAWTFTVPFVCLLSRNDT